MENTELPVPIFRRFHVNHDDITIAMRHACVCYGHGIETCVDERIVPVGYFHCWFTLKDEILCKVVCAGQYCLQIWHNVKTMYISQRIGKINDQLQTNCHISYMWVFILEESQLLSRRIWCPTRHFWQLNSSAVEANQNYLHYKFASRN